MESHTHPRRYAKACDACHQKKIRCVYRAPACNLCRKTGQECKFTCLEKAQPKQPRRGKYFAALEQRLKNMETLLQEARSTKKSESSEGVSARAVNSRPIDSQAIDINAPNAQAVDGADSTHLVKSPNGLRLPTKNRAIHLAQGYFASFNHLFPIFDKGSFMRRIQEEYPPDKEKDLPWWSAVVIVLGYAHRLRAMSTPGQAGAEDNEACLFLREALDLAPLLTYSEPSLASAQVLLGIASVLRGTNMSDPASMLVAAAVRMLQYLNLHKDDTEHDLSSSVRKERERAFWVAYILDNDNALQTRQPPLLQEQDIGRPRLSDQEEDGVGIVRSLDSTLEVNLFAVSQRLASIQASVWNRVHSTAANGSRIALEAAQHDLNPLLVAWKNDLPFEFKQEDLVGRWPKHAIVHIVVLHFRYFQTLAELNKVPPIEDTTDPLFGNCPTSRLLPRYPHSTSIVAVESARNALDLAALTPRGNFQNVWLFVHFSISAVLTLLVNNIIRPLDEYATQDLQRVDVWLQMIGQLATDSERPDLLEKRDFLRNMRHWSGRVVQEAMSGEDLGARSLPCLKHFTGEDPASARESQFEPDASIWDAHWIPGLSGSQDDISLAGFWQPSELWESWPNNEVVFNELY